MNEKVRIQPLTPEKFAEKMREIFERRDCEMAHHAADELMCDLLRSLGYGAGVEVFENADRWYA